MTAEQPDLFGEHQTPDMAGLPLHPPKETTVTTPLDLPVCDNGPHSAPADPAWQDHIWHRLDDGRLICGGCWNVGGILNDPKGPTDA